MAKLSMLPSFLLARSLVRRLMRNEKRCQAVCILLVTTDNGLDGIPWEYAHGSEDASDFLVVECHVVRGLPADQCSTPPVLETGLHIVAVPSNPLSRHLEPLNIEGEWMR